MLLTFPSSRLNMLLHFYQRLLFFSCFQRSIKVVTFLTSTNFCNIRFQGKIDEVVPLREYTWTMLMMGDCMHACDAICAQRQQTGEAGRVRVLEREGNMGGQLVHTKIEGGFYEWTTTPEWSEDRTAYISHKICNLQFPNDIENKSGGSGHRSWYLSHANWALYYFS